MGNEPGKSGIRAFWRLVCVGVLSLTDLGGQKAGLRSRHLFRIKSE